MIIVRHKKVPNVTTIQVDSFAQPYYNLKSPTIEKKKFPLKSMVKWTRNLCTTMFETCFSVLQHC